MKFAKYHGAGNDFLLVDGVTAGDHDWAALAIAMCERNVGAGADVQEHERLGRTTQPGLADGTRNPSQDCR
ncbi:MAG TPA: hypothetical protein VI759_09620 [Dehalococcoidia bacterium]|nr:hypothetical protein [Dehalococcoidia bacterium]